MAKRLWKVLGCAIAAVVLISSCSSSPIILGVEKDGDKDTDLTPLSQLIQADTEKIQLVLVHGVGDHCKNFALDHKTGWLNDENLKAMGLTKIGSSGAELFESNAANLTALDGVAGCPDVVSKIVYQTQHYNLHLAERGKDIPVQAVEITWSPLTSWIKTRQLGYDSPNILSDVEKIKADCLATPTENSKVLDKSRTQASPPSRMYANGLLKEDLMDRKLADALLYSGTYGKIIQRGVAEVLCHVATKNNLDAQCTWPAAVPPDIAKSQYIFVTHSIGSRLMFDTILNLKNFRNATERNPFLHWLKPGADPTILANHIISKTSVVYMMANQLPMLGLANLDPTVNSGDGPQPYAVDPKRMRSSQAFNSQDGTCATMLGQFSQAKQDTKGTSEKLYIVSFNDTNDLLTWHIPPWYTKAGQGTGECESNIELRNVFVQNSFRWLLFESPIAAHTAFFQNKDVWQAIACGGDKGKLKSCLQ